MTDSQIVVRLVVSAILSSLIGLERQMHRRAAGLRTHILVSLGSTLIMLTSIYISDINNNGYVDPSRIAAGVITGIGFLGAGTIIRYGEEVRGLTTAASLWVAAGIGLSVGCGFYSAAFTSTAIVLLVLLFLGRLENKVLGKVCK